MFRALSIARSLQVSRRLVNHTRREVATTSSGASHQVSLSSLIAVVGAGFLAAIARSLIGEASILDCMVSAFSGAGLGWLVLRHRAAAAKARTAWNLERAVPNILERIVMGVTAGLDVIPALKVAASSQAADAELEKSLQQVVVLHERGLSFSKALEVVCEGIRVPSARHAFIHLGIAQQQGGELVRPLRELADATQLAFQERVDEEIAKLPVKATMPLLLTFAGLIIFFITIPVVQVSSMTKKITESVEDSK